MENKIRDALGRVTASDEMKRATLDRLSRTGVRPQNNWARSLAAACAALVLLLGGGGYWAVAAPVSYVSIDAAPSVELCLNRFDRVVSVTGYGENGELALEGLDLKGKTYTDAIDILLSSEAMAPYLTDLTITVATDHERHEAALLSGIESCAGYQRHGVESYCADVSDWKAAHGCGMSLGKYAAAQALMDCDDTVSLEDCRDMTMGQLKTHIAACHGDSYGGGNGAGNDVGNAVGGTGGHHGWSNSNGHHGG